MKDTHQLESSLLEIQNILTSEKTIAELYSENGIVRALTQLIPTVGPIIDSIIAIQGNKIKEKRLILLVYIIYIIGHNGKQKERSGRIADCLKRDFSPTFQRPAVDHL